MRDRLVEEIADHRTQRAGQDEGRPEQQRLGNARGVVRQCDQRERAAENARGPKVAERSVRHPVAQRSAQRLREGDRDPVEQLRLAGMDRGRRNPAERAVPGDQRQDDQREQQDRSARVSDAERSRREIGQRGARGGRGDDRRPVEPRIEPPGADLKEGEDRERGPEDHGAHDIAVQPRLPRAGRGFAQPAHADGVARGLSQSGCEDLDDPEPQRDRRHLRRGFHHCVSRHFAISICPARLPAVAIGWTAAPPNL